MKSGRRLTSAAVPALKYLTDGDLFYGEKAMSFVETGRLPRADTYERLSSNVRHSTMSGVSRP